jgi:hypothetical protein
MIKVLARTDVNDILSKWTSRLEDCSDEQIRTVLANYVTWYQLDMVDGAQDVLTTLNSKRQIIGYILATKPVIGAYGLLQFLNTQSYLYI